MFEEWMPAGAGPGRTAAALLVAIAIAYVVAVVAARLTRAAFAVALRDGAGRADADARRTIRLVRWTTFLVLTAAMVLPAVRLAGIDLAVGLTPRTLVAWLVGPGLRIAVMVVAGCVLVRLVSAFATRLEAHLGRLSRVDEDGHIRRARTLSRLLQSTMTTIIVVVTGLTVLRELEVDITPILTGAGILGLAVGFGGQTLVRDLISGFFLIVENQIRVGDTAVINGTTGVVETINLRTVVLRDGEGTVHVFPNGSIDRLANRSKDYSVFVTDIDVARAHDPDEIMALLRAVGDQLLSDAAVRAVVLEPLQVQGIETIRDAQMTIRISLRTLPQKHAEVGRELLRRVKKAFDANGIALPVSRMALQMADDAHPLLVRTGDGTGGDR
jgi:small conductance mechanosensitive channel